MSGVPVWAQESGPSYPRGRMTVAGGRDETPSKNLGRSGSSKRNLGEGHQEDSRLPKLGRTTGVFAAGAWAARLEIARLLESGISAETLISEINSGQESDTPLEMRGSQDVPLKSDPRREDLSDAPRDSAPSGTAPGRKKERSLERSKRSRETSREEKKSEKTYSRSTSHGDPQARGGFLFPAPPDFPPPGRFGFDSSLDSSRGTSDRKPKLSSGEPVWASSGTMQYSFGKKASAPATLSDGYSPTTPEEVGEMMGERKVETDVVSLSAPPDKFSIPEGIGSFRKRAEKGPPIDREDPAPKQVPPIQTKRPVRQSVLDGEKLGVFRSLAVSIFEDLVILQVEMELLPDVMGEKGQIDEKKFELFTQPRSPGTGLRYARLLKLYLKEMFSKYTNENRPEVFGSTAIQSYVFQLIEEEVGFMTPLSFIYAVEHFATIFGFEAPGARSPRVRRFATDYSKKAPEKKQAPPLSVAFLDYLEKAVLDHTRPLEFRMVMGKLRLCTQASIRHSDLATTALDRVEWCRIVGEERVLGLRAKANKTKSGPRPWSASMLGVNPRNDEWMITFVEILFRVHGPNWRTHSFLGCAGDGKGGFICVPPTIGEDVIVMFEASYEARPREWSSSPTLRIRDLQLQVALMQKHDAELDGALWHQNKSHPASRCMAQGQRKHGGSVPERDPGTCHQGSVGDWSSAQRRNLEGARREVAGPVAWKARMGSHQQPLRALAPSRNHSRSGKRSHGSGVGVRAAHWGRGTHHPWNKIAPSERSSGWIQGWVYEKRSSPSKSGPAGEVDHGLWEEANGWRRRRQLSGVKWRKRRLRWDRHRTGQSRYGNAPLLRDRRCWERESPQACWSFGRFRRALQTKLRGEREGICRPLVRGELGQLFTLREMLWKSHLLRPPLQLDGS